MSDLEFVIDFLLREKKFQIEITPQDLGCMSATEVRVAYWDGEEYHHYKQIKPSYSKLHECVLLVAMNLEKALREQGVIKCPSGWDKVSKREQLK